MSFLWMHISNTYYESDLLLKTEAWMLSNALIFLCFAWKIPWTEEPGGLQSMGSLSRTWLSNFTFTFHFHALEKETATHSSVLAWRIPGMGEPGGLPSMGSHRVRHDWSDLAAIAAVCVCMLQLMFFRVVLDSQQNWGKGTEIYQVTPTHDLYIASSFINMHQESGTFITIDKLILTYHNH